MTRLLLLVTLVGLMVRMVLSVVVVVLMLLVRLVVLMLMLLVPLVGVMLITVLSVVACATGARAVPPDPAAAEEPGAGRHGTSAAGTSSSTPCLLPPVVHTIHPLHRHTYIPLPPSATPVSFLLMPTFPWLVHQSSEEGGHAPLLLTSSEHHPPTDGALVPLSEDLLTFRDIQELQVRQGVEGQRPPPNRHYSNVDGS